MSASSKSHQKKPPLIFVVDDNPDLTKMAEMVLTDEGYRCQTFSDPRDVVEIFKKAKHLPDLLLTDYDMGSMNGLELISLCRANAPHLKTLLLSGTIEAGLVLRHPVKVDHFLSKPYRPKELAALVKSLLT
jgi:CheY-like chemotaxis protein